MTEALKRKHIARAARVKAAKGGKMLKKWKVEYSHKDGRRGVVNAITEIEEIKGNAYGNGKAGLLTVGDFSQGYDLRYESGDLHMVMLTDYFGCGLVRATEV